MVENARPEILEELDVDAAIIMFRMLPKDVSVEVFSYLPSEDQVDIISGITEREISYIIEELDFDDKIDVFGRTAGQCSGQKSWKRRQRRNGV